MSERSERITSNARISIAETTITVATDTGEYVIPRGIVSLTAAHISNDPPLPEQLTNAIGEIVDHLDDAMREVPDLLDATAFIVSGAAPAAIAAVEIGAVPTDALFELHRDAAEDVFRTLATEARAERRRNPGLPGELVDHIVAGCCALVAIYRTLRLDTASIETGSVETNRGDG